MKALQLVAPRKLELRDVPDPVIDPERAEDADKCVVNIKACGLCGTDKFFWKSEGWIDYPRVLGHEIAGTIEDVGEMSCIGERTGPWLQPGDRVIINNIISCQTCDTCRANQENLCQNQHFLSFHVDGGLAQKIKVPYRNLVKLPNNVSFEVGSLLACAGGTALRAINIAHLRTAESVVVWGSSGVGLFLVLLAARITGAYPIILVGRHEHQLMLGEELGADYVVHCGKEDVVERVESLTGGASVVFDTAGVTEKDDEGYLVTLRHLRPGGQLISIASFREPLELRPHQEIGVFERDIKGSAGYLQSELEGLVKLTAARRFPVWRLIDRTVKLEAVPDLMEEWDARGGVTRVIVAPNGKPVGGPKHADEPAMESLETAESFSEGSS